MKLKDLTGQKIGSWSVIKYYGSDGGALWQCKCECGSEKVVRGRSLIHGKSRSCGCLAKKIVSESSIKHGHNTNKGQSPTYVSWRSMLRRCSDKNHNSYHNYGGRGIKVCTRWKQFENFLSDMGERPNGMTLDRKDVDGDYCVENCKWASPTEQGFNMRKNRMITYRGKTQTVAQWARELNINDGTIRARLSRDWTDQQALCKR